MELPVKWVHMFVYSLMFLFLREECWSAAIEHQQHKQSGINYGVAHRSSINTGNAPLWPATLPLQSDYIRDETSQESHQSTLKGTLLHKILLSPVVSTTSESKSSVNSHAQLIHHISPTNLNKRGALHVNKEVKTTQAQEGYDLYLRLHGSGRKTDGAVSTSGLRSYISKDHGIDQVLSKALRQESGEGSETQKETDVPRMVVTAFGSLVALLSMSLLVAIFQCCCRRKRSNSSDSKPSSTGTAEDKNETDNDLQQNVGQEENKSEATQHKVRKEESKSKVQEIEKYSEEKAESRESSQEPQDKSVKNKIKAFEVKKEFPKVDRSPDTRHGRKRPESEAFKVFENKGILIGMGRQPEQDTEDENVENTQPSPRLKINKGFKVLPDNPDVVIASDDEDEDHFAVIKRQSEVLKSFTRAPPPKNRNRSSQGLGLGRKKRALDAEDKPITAVQVKEEKEKTPSSADKKKEDALDAGDKNGLQKTNSKECLVNSSTPKSSRPSTPSKHLDVSTHETENKRGASPQKDQVLPVQTTDNKSKELLAPVTIADRKSLALVLPVPMTQKTPEIHPAKTKSGGNTPTQDLLPTSDNSAQEASSLLSEIDKEFNNSGNIFLQIDPTVKRQSPSVTPPKLIHSQSSPAESSNDKTTENFQGSSKPKQDENFMKALSDKLKIHTTEKEETDL